MADLEDNPEDLLLQWGEARWMVSWLWLPWRIPMETPPVRRYLSEGQHSLQLHVTDTMGKSVTESLVLQVGGPNTPPGCEIIAPADGVGVSVEKAVDFQGLATDADVSSTQLSYVWKSDKDGDLGTGTIASDGSIYFSYDALTAATHAISLEVSDEVGEQCTDLIFLSVGTAPPLT